MDHDQSRATVKELDEVLGKQLPVIAGGFVRLVDYMGSDSAIVQAARISYGAGTKKLSEDRGLIRYLIRHNHTTPFEMCELKLHVRAPMDVWRQWIRHRTANVNEYSTRYSIAIDDAFKTAAGEWRLQDGGNRQGSAGLTLADDLGKALSEEEALLQERAREVYENRIKAGVAREQARKDLPLSTFTEAYWKIDLHNLLHFLRLRMDSHAQLEIRQYAEVIGYQIVKAWCPMAWEAFEDYRLHALSLSKYDATMIQHIALGRVSECLAQAVELGYIDSEGKARNNRERREFEIKLRRLGMSAPWI